MILICFYLVVLGSQVFDPKLADFFGVSKITSEIVNREALHTVDHLGPTNTECRRERK